MHIVNVNAHYKYLVFHDFVCFFFFLRNIKKTFMQRSKATTTQSCFSFLGISWVSTNPILLTLLYRESLIYLTVQFLCCLLDPFSVLAWTAPWAGDALAAVPPPSLVSLSDGNWFWFSFAWQCAWQPHQSRQKLWQSGTAWMYERRWGWGQRAASGEQR